MGKRGPKRTPTAILEREGSWRGKARTKTEPKPRKGRPVQPRWLPADAKRVWRQLVPRLEAMGVLTVVDGAALERYCVMLVQWRRLIQWLERQSATVYPILDDRGNAKCWQTLPQMTSARQLDAALARHESSFGLTPSARAGLAVQAKEQEDEFTTFLRQRTGGA